MDPESRARHLILSVYGGAMNFMTPTAIEFGIVHGKYAWELRTGKFVDSILYGVTVVTLGGAKCPELSKCFHSEAMARGYILGLGGADAEAP